MTIEDRPYRAKGYYAGAVVDEYELRRTSTRMERRKWTGELDALQQLLANRAAFGSILDVPCGTGRYNDVLAVAGVKVVSADISVDMVARARSRGGTSVTRVDVEHLPFRDRALDAALVARFANLVPLDVVETALHELRRVVRSWIAIELRLRTPGTGATVARRMRDTVRLATRPLRRRPLVHQAGPPRAVLQVHCEADFLAVCARTGWTVVERSEVRYKKVFAKVDPLAFIVLHPSTRHPSDAR